MKTVHSKDPLRSLQTYTQLGSGYTLAGIPNPTRTFPVESEFDRSLESRLHIYLEGSFDAERSWCDKFRRMAEVSCLPFIYAAVGVPAEELKERRSQWREKCCL